MEDSDIEAMRLLVAQAAQRCSDAGMLDLVYRLLSPQSDEQS